MICKINHDGQKDKKNKKYRYLSHNSDICVVLDKFLNFSVANIQAFQQGM